MDEFKVNEEKLNKLRLDLESYECFTKRDIKEILRTLKNMNHQIERLEEDKPIQIKLASNPNPVDNIDVNDMVGVMDQWESFFVECTDQISDDLFVGKIKNHLLSYDLSDNLVPYNMGDKIFFTLDNVIYSQT